jgi:hypothetical protein
MAYKVLDIQQMVGQDGAYRNITGQGMVYAKSTGTDLPLKISYTPPVDCWWKVKLHVSIVQYTSTDAWRYGYFYQRVTPQPGNGRTNESNVISVGIPGGTAGGTSATSIQSQISPDVYANRHILKLWQLEAGVPYTCYAGYYTQDAVGAWSYYCNGDHLWLQGVAIER